MEITKATAKLIYPHVPDSFRAELEKAFGKDCFKKADWLDIKTFEDACKDSDINPDAVCNDTDTSDEAAYKKLKIIVQAINQGWIPDWDNTNQRKWYPWFNLSSGFGFVASYYGYAYSRTYVGSHLCFETQEKADYAGKQFTGLYKDFLTITK